MRIFYDKEKSMELMKRIEDKFGEENKYQRGTEIHVSDLCYCLMKTYCRITGIERQQTKSSIGVMVFGIIAETVLGWTYPKDVLQYKSSMPMTSEEENIFGHIDVFEEFKYPLEVKASRKQVFMANQVPPQWIEQLISYMSMEGCQTGWIVIFNIFSTQIIAFQINLTREEILDWQIALSTRRIQTLEAIKLKDPTKIPIRADEYSFCDYRFKCPKGEECYKKSREIVTQKAKDKETKKPAIRYDPFQMGEVKKDFNPNLHLVKDKSHDKMQTNLENIKKSGKELIGEK